MSRKTYNQELAQEFVNSDDYLENLIYMNDYECFYLWSGCFPGKEEGHYIKLSNDDICQMILNFCETRFPNQNYTNSLIEDVKKLIKYKIYRRFDQEDDKYIAFKDVLLNVETFKVEPFDKQKICTLHFPYYFEETLSPTPIFDKFLATSLVYENNVYKTDEQLVELTKEMMGMFLLNNLKASKAFFLYGPTASNGKSQLGLLLQRIFGREYCSNLSLADLSDRFAPISLIGKRVNVAGELDEKFGNSKMFKSLVSGDYIKGEYKFGGNISFKSKAKFIFMTNKIPTFDGLDRGVRRRLMILPFYRTFDPSDKDFNPDLEEELTSEIKGVIGVMINYAKKLKQNGYRFTETTATSATLRKFDNEMSSASLFLEDDKWEVSDDKERYISKTTLYDNYRDWSRDTNKKAVSKNRFYDDLQTLIPGLEETRVYRDGRQERCFNLVQLFDDDIPDSLFSNGSEIVQGTIDDIKFND